MLRNDETSGRPGQIRKNRFRHRHEEAVALVIVLAFVVLLTGLVVAYFSRSMTDRQLSNSSFKRTQVDELARSALEVITSDLKQEIVNGSTILQGDPVNPNPAYPIIYQPSSSAYYVPVRNTPTNPTSTLIRISATNSIALPGVDHSSSSASSTGTSANGRSISPGRWNHHYLLPRKTTGASTDTTPVTTGTAAFTAPSWVYVTGAGPTVLASPTNSVVGRYAYAIYDESALLDVNVAGYPTAFIAGGGTAPLPASTPHPSPDPYNLKMAGYANKGSLAFADLSQLLPTTGTPSLSAVNMVKVVNALVGWRNYASAQSSGSFPNYTFAGYSASAPGAGSRFYDMVLTNKTGFLTVSGSTFNSSTDQAFLSRQQLINLCLSLPAAQLPSQDMLQYLGTFSRAVTAPSWCPPLDAAGIQNPAGAVSETGTNSATTPIPTGSNGAGNVYAYKTNAESPTSGSANSLNGGHNPNRDLANIRWTTSGTITHYNDDGTAKTYIVKIGDIMLQRRFSLAKLAWLGHNGPNASAFNPSLTPAQQAAAIKACFGLTWEANTNATGPTASDSSPSANARWEYATATLAPGVYVKTLDQVSAGSPINGSIIDPSQNDPPREPNFFELLKAGILAGSLGQSPGQAAAWTNLFKVPGASPTTVVPNGNTHEPYHDPNWDEGPGGMTYSGDPDHHILQIGANIIGQFKTDSFPIAIYFHNHTESATQPLDSLVQNTVYSDENLPYIQRYTILTYVDPLARDGAVASVLNSGSTGDQNFKFWLQPELWNPHQASALIPSGSNVPSAFRIHAYGQTWANWGVNSTGGSWSLLGNNEMQTNVSEYSATGVTDYDLGTTTVPRTNTSVLLNPGEPPASWGATITPSTCKYLYFQEPAGTTSVGTILSRYYTAPHFLIASDVITGTTDPLNYYDPRLSSFAGNSSNVSGHIQWSGTQQYAGIYIGKADFPRTNTISGSASTMWDAPYATATVTDYGESLTLGIDYYDGTSWLPYTFIPRVTVNPRTQYFFNPPPAGTTYVTPPTYAGSLNPAAGTIAIAPDVRTYRFGPVVPAGGNPAPWPPNVGTSPGMTVAPSFSQLTTVGLMAGDNVGFPCRSQGFTYIPNAATTNPPINNGVASWCPPNGYYYDFMVNNPAATNLTLGGTSVFNTYYCDPDGVVRPGDNFRASAASAAADTGDGRYTYPASALTNSASDRRPVILNRPFRSVGELGYTFRDLPGKNLDFWTKLSADAALLDLFSVSDEPAIVAGEINPSNAPSPVLQAIIGKTMLNENENPYTGSPPDPKILTLDLNASVSTAPNASGVRPTMASGTIATQLAYYFSGPAAPHPLGSRADLVSAISAVTDAILSGTGLNGSALTAFPNMANKAFSEAPVRALSSVTNTRTWNLMIDVIAQTGNFVPNAADLNKNFVVQGERRYWLHIAIDRLTGQIIDEQLEPVYE